MSGGFDIELLRGSRASPLSIETTSRGIQAEHPQQQTRDILAPFTGYGGCNV